MDRFAAQIQIDADQHEQFAALVEATEFGSGDMRYRRLGVSAQLARFNKPVFFHALDSSGELVGVYVLDERDLCVAGKAIKGYYRGVLAVDERSQGQGIGRQLSSVAKNWIADGESPVALSYGCIDQGNRRSLALLESTGAYVMSTLSMYMMYRQRPSVSCTVEPITSVQAIDANNAKAELYADCLVKDLTHSRSAELALCDKQGIAISARVHPSAFNITRMGSVATFATRWFVKPFPFARKRFDPESFNYVTFSDILIRQGSERLWPRFVSTVLAQQGCHFGMTYVDPKSQLFARLQKASPLTRLMHSRQGSIKVVLRSCGLDKVVDAGLRENSAAVKLFPIDV